MEWPVMALCKAQLMDVNKEDILCEGYIVNATHIKVEADTISFLKYTKGDLVRQII